MFIKLTNSAFVTTGLISFAREILSPHERSQHGDAGLKYTESCNRKLEEGRLRNVGE